MARRPKISFMLSLVGCVSCRWTWELRCNTSAYHYKPSSLETSPTPTLDHLNTLQMCFPTAFIRSEATTLNTDHELKFTLNMIVGMRIPPGLQEDSLVTWAPVWLCNIFLMQRTEHAAQWMEAKAQSSFQQQRTDPQKSACSSVGAPTVKPPGLTSPF
ncbi:uncharacterized protein LOC121284822 [Carcharodon carcharias]|uniref:uncharacterized protein LOC121284822 n=1 Tax=Carcharodon carcharias TaxID=13397 RepID=UPI001B7EACC7|nr:uncharacterized protein LOC121284822 [Carcharodon carcharias]